MILDGILFAGFIFAFAKGWETRVPLEEVLNGSGEEEKKREKTEKKSYSLNTHAFKKNWQEIEVKVGEGTPHSLVLAVISADNLVDDALKQMGFVGEHMADRLQQITYDDFNQLEDLWKAHKIRNELVHTPGFELKKREAEEMLRVYESFLRTVRALK